MIHALVIEDDPNIRENIVQTLDMEGLKTSEAPEGETGIRIATHELPDIIICDILMPGVNGYEVLTSLRSNPLTESIPFIFLTALASRTSQRQGMNLGADDYVTKPFKAEELLDAVHARLEKHNKTQKHYADQVNTLRDTVIRALPHELRTPLTGLLGCADFLVMDWETIPRDSLKKIGELMVSSTNRLHHLTENYLLYAQIELAYSDRQKIITMRQERCDSPDLSVMVAVDTESTLADRVADIEMDVQPGVAAIGEHNLTRMVTEIVSNAFKFSDPGTPVQITAGPGDDGYYTIQVRNEGRGMTADQIDCIGALVQFERAIYEQQGLGLGLIITKRLSEIYGGQFCIESVPGEYITVQISLPALEVD